MTVSGCMCRFEFEPQISIKDNFIHQGGMKCIYVIGAIVVPSSVLWVMPAAQTHMFHWWKFFPPTLSRKVYIFRYYLSAGSCLSPICRSFIYSTYEYNLWSLLCLHYAFSKCLYNTSYYCLVSELLYLGGGGVAPHLWSVHLLNTLYSWLLSLHVC